MNHESIRCEDDREIKFICFGLPVATFVCEILDVFVWYSLRQLFYSTFVRPREQHHPAHHAGASSDLPVICQALQVALSDWCDINTFSRAPRPVPVFTRNFISRLAPTSTTPPFVVPLCYWLNCSVHIFVLPYLLKCIFYILVTLYLICRRFDYFSFLFLSHILRSEVGVAIPGSNRVFQNIPTLFIPRGK